MDSERSAASNSHSTTHWASCRNRNAPTNFFDEPESEAHAYLKDVENIFTRQKFATDAASIVPQMMRAGLRRYEEQRDLLTRMDSLSRRVATGKATGKNRADLKSLQGYFQVDVPSIISLDTVLGEFEAAKKSADALRLKVERRLKPAARKR